jgi:hypothetical protein
MHCLPAPSFTTTRLSWTATVLAAPRARHPLLLSGGYHAQCTISIRRSSTSPRLQRVGTPSAPQRFLALTHPSSCLECRFTKRPVTTAAGWHPEQDPKLQILNFQPPTPNPKPQTQNPHCTLNARRQTHIEVTPNPKPQTQNPQPTLYSQRKTSNSYRGDQDSES